MALVGPKQDHRPGELRSIAHSIQPLFPSSSETLRAIANTLEEELDDA